MLFFRAGCCIIPASVSAEDTFFSYINYNLKEDEYCVLEHTL